MRKIHLRCVVDAELVVFQTLCGLRVSPGRPVTDKEEEITCSVCRQIAVEQANLKVPPQVEKKSARRKS